MSTVIVFEADDIVLSQAGARLDFNQVERFGGIIFQPTNFPDRDIGRLVREEAEGLVPATHQRFATHHNPMFGSVLVFSQK